MNEHSPKRHVVIGTAGHIDHGKTSLIKALTGRDLDKLDEEKRRGITIELGFAFYGDHAAFVDVPGHEKLVKTMIAGASAMSAAMLVIAADDGVMPQTREHLTVLDSLGVKRGIVVVSKADLVDNDWLDLVVEEARELLEGTSLAGSDVLAVDNLSGRGIDELRATLDSLVKTTPIPGDEDFFRLPIDRSFTIKGHGRVVTGTVWNGTAQNGQKIRLLPSGHDARVRSLQAHEESVDSVSSGDRAALNLTTEAEPERGDVLISRDRGIVTDFLDISLSLAPDARGLKQRARIRVHLGTAEVLGRLLLIDREFMQPGEQADVRIALEAPIVTMHGDLGVLRFYSPTDTLGGIRVLDPNPPDRKRTAHGLLDRLRDMHGKPNDAVLSFVRSRTVMTVSELLQMIPVSHDELASIIDQHVEQQQLIHLRETGSLVPTSAWDDWLAAIPTTLKQYHAEQPNDPGMPANAVLQTVLGEYQRADIGDAILKALSDSGSISEDSGLVRLCDHAASISNKDMADAERVHAFLVNADLIPPVPSVIAEELKLAENRVRELLKALKNVRRVVILEDKLVLAVEAVNHARAQLSTLPEEFKLAEFNAAVGTSRKVGAPLLGYFDKQGVTVRDGDIRRLIKTTDA